MGRTPVLPGNALRVLLQQKDDTAGCRDDGQVDVFSLPTARR